jgi:E3 ubiquitin-protein ligase HERC3
VAQIVVGSEHSCVRFDDGSVKCWGSNFLGHLGLGDKKVRGSGFGQMGSSLPRLDFGPGRKVVDLSAGSFHTCARLDDGAVKCWGSNGFGELGLGDTQDRGDAPGEMGSALPSVSLAPGRTVQQLAAGANHSCALLDDGSVQCWGRNNFGQLGLGDNQTRGDGPGEMGASLPTVVLGPGRTALQVVVGFLHSCARLDDNSVKCWGSGQWGALGLGDVQARGDDPAEMSTLPTVNLGGAVVEIAARLSSTCARLDDASVKCWGSNTFGNLGLGDTKDRGAGPGEMGASLPPLSLGPGLTVSRLDGSCALFDGGAVKCWAFNTQGQLGLGDFQHRGDGPGEMGATLPALDFGPGRTVVQLAKESNHACVKLDDGSVKCWGRNYTGQLGIGDTKERGGNPGEMGAKLPTVQFW